MSAPIAQRSWLARISGRFEPFTASKFGALGAEYTDCDPVGDTLSAHADGLRHSFPLLEALMFPQAVVFLIYAKEAEHRKKHWQIALLRWVLEKGISEAYWCMFGPLLGPPLPKCASDHLRHGDMQSNFREDGGGWPARNQPFSMFHCAILI